MIMHSHYSKRPRVRTPVVGVSRAKQSMAKECDINNIMRKYQKSGAVSHFNRHASEYGFASGADFSESMRVITLAQGMFDDLPSSVRSRFGNSPGAFLDFVQDDGNKSEMKEMGLMADGYTPESTPAVAAPVGDVVEPEVPPVG